MKEGFKKMIDINDKKVAKNVIKLCGAIKRASREDLVLLASMTSVRITYLDDKNGNAALCDDVFKCIESIEMNDSVLCLLGCNGYEKKKN